MDHSTITRKLILFVIVWLATSTSLLAQWMGGQTGCYSDSIRANPNRPTVANPADITQYGVLELESGWDRSWPRPDSVQSSVGELLKFGLLCDVELRWNSTVLLSQTDVTGTRRSFGDNWLGPQVRIYRQTKRVPTLAFSYAIKIPSANEQKGLGTGQTDHSFTFLASKEILSFHLDFNVTHFLVGRSIRNGFDQNDQLNLAFSRPIRGGLQFTGEIYGETQLTRTMPGFASSLWALTFQITPRLVVDGGFEGGLSSGGPQRRVFAGVTYSIANLYPGWRRSRPRKLVFDEGLALAPIW